MAPHGEFATAPSDHGTFISLILVQFLKAVALIDVGVPRNRMEVSPTQSINALGPIDVTPDGISVIDISEQLLKALAPITVKPDGNSVKRK